MSNTHQSNEHCYLRLERFSLFYRDYAIVDVADYYADQLFIQHQVNVHFEKDYIKHGINP